MYLSLKEYYLEICKSLDTTVNNIWIATFNTYPGITQYGIDVRESYKVQNGTADILDVLNCIGKKCKIICGIPPLIHCNDKYCEDCNKKWQAIIKRYLKTAEKWKNVEWKFREEFHLKYFIIEYSEKDPISFVGSRNFTDSCWKEIMIKLPQEESKKLLIVAKDIWNSSEGENLQNLIIPSA